MKPSPWKIVVLFVLAVAAIVLPVALVFLLEFLGPFPYLLHEDQLGPEWSRVQVSPDGSTVVTVHDYASTAAAKTGADVLVASIPWSSLGKTLSIVRYTFAETISGGGLLLPIDNRVIQIEAGRRSGH